MAHHGARYEPWVQPGTDQHHGAASHCLLRCRRRLLLRQRCDPLSHLDQQRRWRVHIFWFQSLVQHEQGGYEANRLVKLACGDFDGKGLDDLAGFYYGNGKTAIHVLLNSGQKCFEYKTSAGWWREEAGYDATRLVAVAAGDYNGDGLDDLCGFYNYGAGRVHLHVWLSDGVSTFKYQGSDGWWRVNSGYEAENIRHVVGGEFAP